MRAGRFADCALGQQAAAGVDFGAKVGQREHGAIGVLDGSDKGIRLVHAGAQGLLHHQMLARFEDLQAHGNVQRVRQGHDHAVNLVVGEQSVYVGRPVRHVETFRDQAQSALLAPRQMRDAHRFTGEILVVLRDLGQVQLVRDAARPDNADVHPSSFVQVLLKCYADFVLISSRLCFIALEGSKRNIPDIHAG